MSFALALLAVFVASPGAFAQTQIVAPCDSSTHQSQWYSVGPDSSSSFKIVASNAGGQNCDIQTTSWNRNHWTMTCWVTWSSSSETDYTCHNWNTVWGDSWSISFSYMACPSSGCATNPREVMMNRNIEGALNREGAGIQRTKK